MEELKLVEKLRYCPIGTRFYSSLFGWVIFKGVNIGMSDPITVESSYGTPRFNSKAEYISGYEDAEPTLFPSKDNRDWSTVDWSTPPLKKGDLVVFRVNFGKAFRIGTYVSCNTCIDLGHDGYKFNCDAIIPYDKFNARDIKESLTFNIVK